MKNIVIIGAGDLGKEVVWLIEDINNIKPTYVILGFLDDDIAKDDGEFYGYRVLGGTDFLEELAESTPLSAIIAIRDGRIRKKIRESHRSFEEWETIVHPTAVIASTSPLGKGSIVFPHVTVSVDSKLGEFDLLYINSAVCNDCEVGDYVSIMLGASVSERAQIGNECLISAGSVVSPYQRLETGVEAGAREAKETDADEKKPGLPFFRR